MKIINEFIETTEEFVIDRLKEIDPLRNEKYSELNDITIAMLFVEVFEDRLCFCPEKGQFLIFNGEKWGAEPKEIERLGQLFAKCMTDFTFNLPCSHELKKIAYKLTDLPRRTRLLKDVQPLCISKLSEFDAHFNLLNVKNGVINLETGEIQPHSVDYKFTKIANAEFVGLYKTYYDYDEDIDEDRWRQFIDEIMSHDKEKADYLQKILGYSLLGYKNEDKFWIFYGEKTRNGKSTLLEAVAGALGDYTSSAEPETFAIKKFNNASAPSEDIARLAGCRFLRVSEPEKMMKLDVQKIKKLTGRDTTSARFLRHNSFEFTPNFSMYWAANSLPQINDLTIFKSNRVKVIPFEESFGEESGKMDKSLRELFASDYYRSVILSWLLEGCLKYQKEGLEEPEAVTNATAEYEKSSDSIASFISSCIKKSETYAAYITAGAAFELYEDYCAAHGLLSEGKFLFFEKLRERGMITKEKYISGRKLKNVLYGFEYICFE